VVLGFYGFTFFFALSGLQLLYFRPVLWFDGSKVVEFGRFCKVLRISVLVWSYGFLVSCLCFFGVLRVSFFPPCSVLGWSCGFGILLFYVFCLVRFATFVS